MTIRSYQMAIESFKKMQPEEIRNTLNGASINRFS